MNQHVGVWSPRTLAPETWYSVAGTIEKLAPKQSVLRLFVNGEPAGEVKTPEVVNYPTDKMGMTIGAVDDGSWQNFDGLIDEVRVYNRALSPAEIQALYFQPWQNGK
ncbi:MAG: LamG domain-containing protein [Chthoniobacteraceae bacterium]